MNLVLGVLVVILAIVTLPAVHYRQELSYLAQMLPKIHNLGETKKVFPTLVRKVESWPEPSSEIFGNSTRILWSFWDSGNSSLPGFAELAMSLSMKRLPSWQLMIVDKHNYRTFVAASELPSTFGSLKATHQKELISVAVLLRYGGAFVDASSVLAKGLDQLWDTAPPGRLFLPFASRASNGVHLLDDRVMLAPARGSKLLRAYQQELVDYFENPATTVAEMKEHAKFGRMQACYNDTGLGMVGLDHVGPYCAGPYLLSMLVHYDSQLMSEVIMLPPARWVFHLGLRTYTIATELDDLDDVSGDLETSAVDMSPLGCLKMVWDSLPMYFRDEPEIAQKAVDVVHLFKVSTDQTLDLHENATYHLQRQSTLGRIYRTLNDPEIPTKQISFKGMKPPPALVDKTKGLCD